MKGEDHVSYGGELPKEWQYYYTFLHYIYLRRCE
jgi:hypothetical protein